jgi:hypothetical protein
MAWLLLALLALCCAPPPKTAEEAKCVALVEAHEDLEILLCGKDVLGECSTNAIMDRHDKEAEACLQN